MASPARIHAEAAGTIIAGRFRIEAPLGMGGMAHVYRVTDLATKQDLALKLLKPEIAQDEQAVARLRREGEVLSKLAHPAIVGMETYGKLEDGRIFIAMELLSGETLGERMRRQGKLSPEELTPIVTGAAAGLAAAHRIDVVHRDLKPDNIFLTGEPVQVKLLDFGISKVFGIDKLTRTGQILGTPRYMAPEQLAADDSVDGRIDVYAMGIILYEALAGTPPFVGTNASDLIVAIIKGRATPLRTYCPSLDPSVEAVVARAMSRPREGRFETAHELAEAWVTAASPRPNRKPVNAGAATSFFGGMEQAKIDEAVQKARDANEDPNAVSGELRAGTFPEMQQHLPQGNSQPTRPSIPHRLAQAPAGQPEHMPQAARAPASAAAPPQEGLAREYAPPPTRIWPMILLALVAGAVTATAVIYFLLGSDEDTGVESSANSPTPPAADQGAPEAAPPVEEPESTVDVSPQPSAVPEPPLDPSPSEGSTGMSTRMPGSRMRASPSEMESAGMGVESVMTIDSVMEQQAPRRRTTNTILREASAALSVGNTPECLRVLDELGGRRPAAAIKLEGDCRQRGGELAAAQRAYQRYCRLFPNGPAIAEVRARVLAAGGTCP